jgi:hypothetical protein
MAAANAVARKKTMNQNANGCELRRAGSRQAKARHSSAKA